MVAADMRRPVPEPLGGPQLAAEHGPVDHLCQHRCEACAAGGVEHRPDLQQGLNVLGLILMRAGLSLPDNGFRVQSGPQGLAGVITLPPGQGT
jgi:hypothetical protein